MRIFRPLLFVLLLSLVAILLAGCPAQNPGDNNSPKQDFPQAAEIDKEITLYFSDQQAQFLVGEKRTVKLASDDAQTVAQAVINELIAGPQQANLVKTVPPEAKLLSLSIENKLATVDFSPELKTKHWGGSTGETMTILSIVNSLTELPEIDRSSAVLN